MAETVATAAVIIPSARPSGARIAFNVALVLVASGSLFGYGKLKRVARGFGAKIA